MTRRFATSIAVVGLAVLAGCGSGLHPATQSEKGSSQGASANQGTVQIRDAQVLADDQMEGVIEMTLINTGSDADSLTSITTTASDSTMISDSASKQLTEVALPSNQSVSFGTSGTTIDLGNLTANLQPGTFVGVTLNFKLAGTITVQMPVETAPSPAS